MKKELTKEQSQHLIDLGVSKDKASGRSIHTVFGTTALSLTYPGCGAKNIATDIEEYKFKIEDFLNGEILPKKLLYDASDDMSVMQFDMGFHPVYEKWYAGYRTISDKYKGIYFLRDADELIDALYELACWYYGEYLKSEKK